MQRVNKNNNKKYMHKCALASKYAHKQINNTIYILPSLVPTPPPTVDVVIVTVGVGSVLPVGVVSVASVASVISVALLELVGVEALVLGSSVGVWELVSVVASAAVASSVLGDVVGVGVVAEDEALVDHGVPVVATVGLKLSIWQGASKTHGGHMCGERQRSAVFDMVS